MEESVRISVKVGPSGVSSVFGQRQPGGMFLATEEVVAPGKTVTLVLEDAEGGRLMQINAKVAWSRPPGANPKFPAGLGLRFKSISTTDVPTIEKMVNGLAPAANGVPAAAKAAEPAPAKTPAAPPPAAPPAAERTPPPTTPPKAAPAKAVTKAPPPKPARVAVEVEEDEPEPAPPAEDADVTSDTTPGFLPDLPAPLPVARFGTPGEDLAGEDPFLPATPAADAVEPPEETPPEPHAAPAAALPAAEESISSPPDAFDDAFAPPEGVPMEEEPAAEPAAPEPGSLEAQLYGSEEELPVGTVPGESPAEETSFEPPPDLPVEESVDEVAAGAHEAEPAPEPSNPEGDFVDPTSPEFEAALGALGAAPADASATAPASAPPGSILCPSCASPIAVGAHVMLVRCRNCGAKINPDEL